MTAKNEKRITCHFCATEYTLIYHEEVTEGPDWCPFCGNDVKSSALELARDSITDISGIGLDLDSIPDVDIDDEWYEDGG